LSPLSFWDYVKAAFHARAEVPALGRMPLNKMGLALFAVLGILNPGFWLLGAALEISYLFWLASSDRFQKVVDGERLLEAQEEWREKIKRAVGRLSEQSQSRYRHLVEQAGRIVGISESLEVDSLGNVTDLRNRSLSQLLSIFLRLLTARELIVANVQERNRSELIRETGQLQEKLSKVEKDTALARSLEGTLDIHRRRLENLDRAEESLKVIDAELARIENQVELIREESAVSGKPEFLSSRLDAVTSTMSETSRWMDQHSDLFQELTGEEAENVWARVPQMPQEKE